MKVGVCYIPTMPGTWEEAIARAGALGFQGFEVTARHPAGRTDPAAPASLLETRRIEAVRHPSSLDELLDHPERVASLRDAARRAGVELNSVAVTGFGPGFRLSDADSAVREATVQRIALLIQRCSELGATVLDDSRGASSHRRTGRRQVGRVDPRPGSDCRAAQRQARAGNHV